MSLTKLKREIVELEAKGDINKLIEALEKAVEEYPNEGTLFNKLGDLYIKKNQIKDAVDIYIKGVEAFKNESYFSNAIALCKKILRYEKDRLEVYQHLGELHGELDQKGEAANYYLQFAEKKFDNGDVEAALDAYNQIKDLVPNNPKVTERIGDIYQQLNHPKEAEKLYNEAIALYESIGEKDKAQELRRKIGAAAEVEEKVGSSIEDLVSPEVAKLLKDETEVVEEESAEVEAEVVEPEVAPEVEEVVEKKEEKVDALAKTLELADLYISLDQTDEALECLSKAGERCYRSRKYEEARDIYLKIKDLSPSDLKSRQRLIEIAHRIKDNDLAADTMVEMARLLLEREAKSQAKKMLNKALEINPSHKEGRAILEKIEEKEKEYIDLGDLLRSELGAEESAKHTIGEIIQEFRKEVFESIGEDDYKSHYDLGVAYKEMGLYTEAIEEFQTSTRDPKLVLKSMEMIATCYYDRSKYKDAITILKRTLKLPGYNDSDFIGIHLLLARSYEAVQDIEAAVREYEIVSHLNPSLTEAKEKIEALKKGPPKKRVAPPPRKGRISYL